MLQINIYIYPVACYATRDNNSIRRINKLPRGNSLFPGRRDTPAITCDYAIRAVRSIYRVQKRYVRKILARITRVVSNSRIMRGAGRIFVQCAQFYRDESGGPDAITARKRETISRFVHLSVSRLVAPLLVQSSSSDEASGNCRGSAKGDFNGSLSLSLKCEYST